MSSECSRCDRSFDSYRALQQHIRDSPTHNAIFDCDPCDRSFNSQEALDQHLRNAPAHDITFDCDPCDKSFNSQEALNQHCRDAPAHNPTFDCDPCDRSFNSQEALDQHLRDAPAHNLTFKCDPCNRSFNSQEALDQHLRDAPAHDITFDCDPCNRSFNSQEAFEQHQRDSPAHGQDMQTPMDKFFCSFPTFCYNPLLPPAESYAKLQEHEGWHRGDRESKQAWADYQEALRGELSLWYGEENSLAAWHALCRAIGILPLPSTCEQCERIVRRTHVNIVDLIEWGRSDRRERVRTFDTVDDLREYTIDTRKIFRNDLIGDDGNIVLRHLLRGIFRANL